VLNCLSDTAPGQRRQNAGRCVQFWTILFKENNMESLRAKYQSKYNDTIVAYCNTLKQLPDSIELNLTDFECVNFPPENVNLVLSKYHAILSTFIFGNSFIGNEFYTLHYISYNIMLYWYILTSEPLSSKEQDSCKLEIKTYFYFFLNCIYNIKEKFEYFVNYDKIKEGGSILTSSSVDKLLNIFNNSYKPLKDYCIARGYIVHGAFSIDYIDNEHKFNISHSTFSLSQINLNEISSKPIFIMIDPENIKLVLSTITTLILESIDIFKNLLNIDFDKLMNKFITTKDGKKVFKITF